MHFRRFSHFYQSPKALKVNEIYAKSFKKPTHFRHLAPFSSLFQRNFLSRSEKVNYIYPSGAKLSPPRPFRPCKPPQDALCTMHKKRGLFSTPLLDAFLLTFNKMFKFGRRFAPKPLLVRLRPCLPFFDFARPLPCASRRLRAPHVPFCRFRQNRVLSQKGRTAPMQSLHGDRSHKGSKAVSLAVVKAQIAPPAKSSDTAA